MWSFNPGNFLFMQQDFAVMQFNHQSINSLSKESSNEFDTNLYTYTHKLVSCDIITLPIATPRGPHPNNISFLTTTPLTNQIKLYTKAIKYKFIQNHTCMSIQQNFFYIESLAMATIEKSSMATLPRMRTISNQLHYNTPSHGTPQLRPDTCIYIITFLLII